MAVYMKNHALFRPIIQSRRTNQWRCYAQSADEKRFDLKEVVDNRALLKGVVQLLKRFAESSADAPICAFVPALEWTSQHDKEIRSVFCDVIVTSTTRAGHGRTLRSPIRSGWVHLIFSRVLEQ